MLNLPQFPLANVSQKPANVSCRCLPTRPMPRHPLGEPAMRWTYRDANGAALFYVLRFDPPDGKEIRPLSLWRAPNGRVEWCWNGLPLSLARSMA